MELPVNLGDVPTWIQGVSGVGQVAFAVWDTRRRRLAEFGRRLQKDSGLDEEAIAVAIGRIPELGPLVFEALESAMRAAAEEKRWLLSKVLSTAFVGDDSRLDEVGIYLRTASSLEPHDIRVLAHFLWPRPQNFQWSSLAGAVQEQDLAGALPPDQRALLAPILSRLSREGLILDVAVGTLDYESAWRLTPYGHQFLKYLPGTTQAEMTRSAVVAVWSQRRDRRLSLRNLGPGRASVRGIEIALGDTSTSIQHSMTASVVMDNGTLVVGVNLDSDPALPLAIDAGLAADVDLGGNGVEVLHAWESVQVIWHDEAGRENQASYIRGPD